MKLLLLPVRFVQLFTQAKSFKHNPIIGSLILNRCGLHVIRIVLAQSIMRLRFQMLGFGIDKDLKRSYFKDGFMVIENAMSEQSFQQIKNQVRSVDAEVRECRQGDTLTLAPCLPASATCLCTSLPQAKTVDRYRIYKP